jgi:oxygen-independent coproporphyrinogen-3 oxidase
MDLSAEDRLRRELMQALYGYSIIDKRMLEDRFGIDFDSHFAQEREHLAELASDGLVVEEADEIHLTAPLGRLLVRVVAAVFDPYLPRNAFREGLPAQLASKVG